MRRFSAARSAVPPTHNLLVFTDPDAMLTDHSTSAQQCITEDSSSSIIHRVWPFPAGRTSQPVPASRRTAVSAHVTVTSLARVR
jgi:hypothetical protein